MNFVCTDSCSRFLSLWGLYDRSVGSSPPKSFRLPAETSVKCLARLTKRSEVRGSATKWCSDLAGARDFTIPSTPTREVSKARLTLLAEESEVQAMS